MSRNAAESALVKGKILALLKPAFGETSEATSTNKIRITIETPKYLFNSCLSAASDNQLLIKHIRLFPFSVLKEIIARPKFTFKSSGIIVVESFLLEY